VISGRAGETNRLAWAKHIAPAPHAYIYHDQLFFHKSTTCTAGTRGGGRAGGAAPGENDGVDKTAITLNGGSKRLDQRRGTLNRRNR